MQVRTDILAVMPSKTSKRASVRRAPTLRRTTVALPSDLLDAADRAVRRGLAASRTELLSRALRRELAAQDRSAIDAAFGDMADDPDYQREAVILAEEGVVAGWEAILAGEPPR